MSAVEIYKDPAAWVRETMPGDLWLVLPTVRDAEITELAALGVTAEQSIREGIRNSPRSFILFLHGEPAGIFGAVFQGDKAIPWAAITTAAERHPLPFLRMSRKYIESLKHVRLENYVDARNEQTIEWLEWLGFTIDAPIKVGINGEPFRKFSKCATG